MSEEQIVEGIQEGQTEGETPANDDGTLLEQTVTEELAEQFGVSKTLVGKPISELGKSMKELTKSYSQIKNQLKEVQKPKEAPQKISAPDPLNFEDPGDYASALKDFNRMVAEEVVQEKLQPLQKLVQTQQEKIVIDTIQSQLPKGMKAENVAEEWMDHVNITQDELAFFTPQLLVDNVVNFAKAKKFSEVSQYVEKESGEKAIEKIRNSLKVQSRDYDLNSVDKTKKSTNTVVDRLLKRHQIQTE